CSRYVICFMSFFLMIRRLPCSTLFPYTTLFRSLPFDVEPYGPGDSEYAAAQRLLRRAVDHLGKRFAQYAVVDSGLATAPFLHTVGALGLPVVARLKENLPELLAAARQRFRWQRPALVFQDGEDRVEIWEADDFDPWETLRWTTVASSSIASTSRTAQ